MSSQVVRVAGFTKGSLSGIGREAERGNVEHRNPDIDPERKGYNMPIKTTEHGFYAEWNRIKTDLNAQGKDTKKGIAFEGMVITAEAKFFEERFGWVKGEPMSPELVQYWRECYNWAVQQIGYKGTDKNIISAVVHADETSLHLQMYYVPITDKWQEKVYAKGEDGKVLRNAKGSPIQAKDANGKTVYRQVEDPDAPKLSRSEFWRVRGGQSSYSRLQDSFHEQIGKRYGLERGEVGSNKEHRTKAQWEQAQLNEQKLKLAEEVAEYGKLKEFAKDKIKEYHDLNVSAEEVTVTGTKMPFGMIAVKENDLLKMQEQAKAYVVNRDEVDEVRDRYRDVRSRENDAYRFEQHLDYRKKELDAREKKLDNYAETLHDAYTRQLNLNRLLEQAEKDNKDLKLKVSSLTAKMDELWDKYLKYVENSLNEIDTLKNDLRGAYESLTNVVKAVGMLKYDKTNEYRVDGLSKKQERLIDGIARYGAEWAKRDGFPDLAEDMEKHVGISKGIRKTIEPKSHEIEL